MVVGHEPALCIARNEGRESQRDSLTFQILWGCRWERGRSAHGFAA
jgi:hypothetical protein